MEVIIGIVGLVVAILISIIPYYRKKKTERPRIDIMVFLKKGSSRPLGLSDKNDFSQGYVDSDSAVRWFQLEYIFEIKIVNNSDYLAYYPRLFVDSTANGFSRIDSIPPLPISNLNPITLSANYIKLEECCGSKRSNVKEFPDDLKSVRLLLEYKNNHKKVFYTLYTFDENGGRNTLIDEISKEEISKFNLK
ncbi:MAG: hypothetical protein WBP58_15070 [Chitinophagaceae bacterium]